jgi:hypothetical protein
MTRVASGILGIFRRKPVRPMSREQIDRAVKGFGRKLPKEQRRIVFALRDTALACAAERDRILDFLYEQAFQDFWGALPPNETTRKHVLRSLGTLMGNPEGYKILRGEIRKTRRMPALIFSRDSYRLIFLALQDKGRYAELERILLYMKRHNASTTVDLDKILAGIYRETGREADAIVLESKIRRRAYWRL